MNESGLSDTTLLDTSGSTYWRKKDSQKAEIFRKIEPYLTFLNIHQFERQGRRYTNQGRGIRTTKPIRIMNH